MIGELAQERVPLTDDMTFSMRDGASYLKSLAAWMEQLPVGMMLVSQDETVCYIDNPAFAARVLRIFLPAESRT